ncbi:MAG TPA: hypothetical protein VND19_03390 [Acetobacteraceae bacterium]|nr:hypothetical protein [Acetobacteraceae bacterium]
MANRTKIRLPASALRLAMLGALAAATLTGTLAGPAFADGHDRDRERHRNDARREPRHYEYYRQPDVYYTAPPVVYAPPGVSINLGFPLYR